MNSGKTAAKLGDKVLFMRKSAGMRTGEKVCAIFDTTTCWTERTGSWTPTMYHDTNRKIVVNPFEKEGTSWRFLQTEGGKERPIDRIGVSPGMSTENMLSEFIGKGMVEECL